MDILSLFSIGSLLNDIRSSKKSTRVSKLEQNIYELSSDLDYYMNLIGHYRNRAK